MLAMAKTSAPQSPMAITKQNLAILRGKPLGFPLKSRHFAAVSSARNARTKSLAQAKPRFCVSAPLFADTSAYGRGEAAAFYNMCALKDAVARGKPFGFPLKSRHFAAVSSARNARTKSLAQAKSHFSAAHPYLQIPLLLQER